jgi:hypothetical protein
MLAISDVVRTFADDPDYPRIVKNIMLLKERFEPESSASQKHFRSGQVAA